MKKLIPILSLAFLAACNSNTGEKEMITNTATQQAPVQVVDTSGYAQYQAWKAQNELAEIKAYNEPERQVAAPVAKSQKAYTAPVRKAAPVTKKKAAPVKVAARDNSNSESTASSESGVMNSEGSNAAEAPVAKKKGLSTTAKTTIIGAAGGAVIGAVVNKKNRAAGAVIGGVLGGGAGYGLGKVLEKKEQSKTPDYMQIN